MGLFGKNAGAGQDGARHWTNVIKNSGPGGLLLWRQPEEDFNTDSTLVVMPVSYTHLSHRIHGRISFQADRRGPSSLRGRWGGIWNRRFPRKGSA